MPKSGFECALAQGIRHFNSRQFYEAHEVWEEQWHLESGEDKRFLQGLIQSAVAFYKLETGNPRGLHKMLQKAIRNFAGCGPKAHGLDMGEFVESLRRWNEKALEMIDRGDGRFSPENLPQIRRALG